MNKRAAKLLQTIHASEDVMHRLLKTIPSPSGREDATPPVVDMFCKGSYPDEPTTPDMEGRKLLSQISSFKK